MMCWYCHWGWPKPVADIYDKYLDIAGQSAMHYGPAHIVWEDENFEAHHVQWCLDHFDDPDYKDLDHHTGEELEAVRASLEELLVLPANIREAEPEGYTNDDKADPKDYPPPNGMVMVHR